MIVFNKTRNFRVQSAQSDSEKSSETAKYTGPISSSYEGFPAIPRRDNKPDVGIVGLSKLQKPVIFSRLAYDKQNYLVAHCDKEISWFGLVSQTDKMFYVEDIILFKQEVSGAQTEIKAEDIDKFFVDLMEEVGEEAALNEYLPKLKMWGHSHVKMGVSPSGTDDATLKYMFRPEMDFFIRLIANKKGDMKVDLYRNFHCAELPDPLSFTWLDTAWDVSYISSEPVPGLFNEMLAKVTNEVRVNQGNQGNYWNGYRNNGNNPNGYVPKDAIGPGVEDKKNSLQQTSTQTNTGNSTVSDSERPSLRHWEYIWWTHTFSYAHYFNRFFNGESVALAGPALLNEDKVA